MKSLIFVAAITLASASFAADAAAPAAQPAAPAAQPAAPAPAPAGKEHKHKKGHVSNEAKKKCKDEHKGDKKAYMECLKAAN